MNTPVAPIHNPIQEKDMNGGFKINHSWAKYHAQMYQQLNYWLASDGIVIPSQNTSTINSILENPQRKRLNKLVYNEETKKLLFNIEGKFFSFVLEEVT